MADQQEVSIRPNLSDPAIRNRVFMAWVVPEIPLPGMDFLIFEPDAHAPVEEIAEPGRSRRPNPLNFLPPAGFHHLIKIKADADINITG